MSPRIDFDGAYVIKLDTMMNQISKAVCELNRQNIPKPFKVQLTEAQLELLRQEAKSLTWVEDVSGADWSIHGCKIEVIKESHGQGHQ